MSRSIAKPSGAEQAVGP